MRMFRGMVDVQRGKQCLALSIRQAPDVRGRFFLSQGKRMNEEPSFLLHKIKICISLD